MNEKMQRELWREVRFLRENGVHKGGALKSLYDEKIGRLRDENEKTNYSGLNYEIIVKQWDDAAIVRIPIGQYPDIETAELFAEKLRIKYFPTYYDCTGQLFTRWQSVHYMAGEYWLWQCNCFDV